MRFWAVPACAVIAAVAYAGGTGTHTSITIWASASPQAAAYGGLQYGGTTPTSGAMITEQRDVEVAANGEVRITGVPATVDPASVQLRSVSDAGGVTVTEQRFVPGATTPDEILTRHIGDQINVVTQKGEVNGVLRSVDAQAIVVEVGTGDQRKLQVMRRDGYVQDVRLPANANVDKPSLVWRLAAKKPGKHTVEVSYRAEGMSWTADYLAVLDDGAKTVDFSAWATVKNATNATFDNAELTLVGNGTTPITALNPIYAQQRAPTAPTRFVVPNAVKLGAGESVQVELLPPRVGAKARSVVTFEAMTDPSGNFQAFAATDCNQLSTSTGAGRAEVVVEVDVPASSPLPDGRVRLFKRTQARLEVVSEDPLRSSTGVARIRLSPDNDIVGERHATSCNYDERAHTIKERIELKLDNKGKQAVDVVAREFMWRWPMWKIDAADESPRGTKAAPQTHEYKVNIPAGGHKTIAYTVTYSGVVMRWLIVLAACGGPRPPRDIAADRRRHLAVSRSRARAAAPRARSAGHADDRDRESGGRVDRRAGRHRRSRRHDDQRDARARDESDPAAEAGRRRAQDRSRLQ